MSKHHAYAVDFKIQALDRLNAGDSLRKVAKDFGVQPVRVREWRNNANALRQHSHGVEKNKRRLNLGKPPISLAMDAALNDYLQDERAAGRVVTNRDLASTALELAPRCDVPATFRASNMYIKRWKKRYNISYRRGANTGQAIPGDYQTRIEV